jgi:hypothetical protein
MCRAIAHESVNGEEAMVTRRTQISLLAAALMAPAISHAKENNMFNEILEASQKDKKGVMLHVRGQSIAGVVVKISGESVELRSREYSRIVVKLEAIDAVSIS